MKKLIAFLLLIIAALQYRLWLGDGGIGELYEMQAHIEGLKQEGERRRARNAALEADVKDLKEGTDAIEERARQELGMVKEGETFVQVFEKPRPAAPKAEASKPEEARPPEAVKAEHGKRNIHATPRGNSQEKKSP